MSDGITIRLATVADVPDLVRLRRTMFEAMGYQDRRKLAASDAASSAYFARAIPAGAFYGWLAVTAADRVVASGGVVVDRHPPGPDNLSGQIGYVMNLVTEPCYRRQGIARHIMKVMLGWLVEKGIQKATLHATDAGRPLYEELGFVDSNEMYSRLGQ